MDPGIVVAIIGGLFALIVALVGLAPHVGRLRRLERIVALIEKFEAGEQRDFLIAERNRIIERMKPKGISSFPFAVVTFVLFLGGVASVLLAGNTYLVVEARGVFAVLTAVFFVAGLVTGIVMIVFIVVETVTEVRKMGSDRRARKAAEGSSTPRGEAAQPESLPGATSPSPARSARRPRSKPPQSD
jgi:uncharacterized membrane protein YciS (DUF1049 family)